MSFPQLLLAILAVDIFPCTPFPYALASLRSLYLKTVIWANCKPHGDKYLFLVTKKKGKEKEEEEEEEKALLFDLFFTEADFLGFLLGKGLPQSNLPCPLPGGPSKGLIALLFCPFTEEVAFSQGTLYTSLGVCCVCRGGGVGGVIGEGGNTTPIAGRGGGRRSRPPPPGPGAGRGGRAGPSPPRPGRPPPYPPPLWAQTDPLSPRGVPCTPWYQPTKGLNTRTRPKKVCQQIFEIPLPRVVKKKGRG